MEQPFIFTVKHVAPDDTITLFAAREVIKGDKSVDCLHTTNDYVSMTLTDGDVFVMNQAGKTVDRFYL